MQILVKYPTRGRPQIFLTRMKEWLDHASDPTRISFLVSYDADDATMTPEIIEKAQAMHPDVTCVCGNSKTKIEACNADLPEYTKPWDVVLLLSDDMASVKKGWDEEIRERMMKHFPDTDGSLWFFDSAQRKINTLTCYGRKYYDRFPNYLYHPDYISFWSDNEQTDVGFSLSKLIYIETPLASHEHPAWNGGMKQDATYRKNHPFYKQDERTYNRRKADGFPA